MTATIIVSGALANRPGNGGGAWVRLSWVRGLARLGFATVFVEQISPEHCVDSSGARTSFDESVNLAYFRQVTDAFGLSRSSALIYGGGEHVYGPVFDELRDMATDAQLLINISGHLTLKSLRSATRRTAYLDLDPGYTQIWHDQGVLPVEPHDIYLTVAQNIGNPRCTLPTGGLAWRTVRQPVVLDDWPLGVEGERARLTTVASWRGPFGTISHNGQIFGSKAHQFRRFVDLAGLVPQTLELALDIDPADESDRERLLDAGWKIVDARRASLDPEDFRRYVTGSGAEFSVAQPVYVDTCSGWFSDRTVRYLAAGRPALVQDTGFSRHLPVGKGLLAFSTLQDAVAGAQSIDRDYAEHCRAAREVAERHFESDLVLGRLLDQLGVGAT